MVYCRVHRCVRLLVLHHCIFLGYFHKNFLYPVGSYAVPVAIDHTLVLSSVVGGRDGALPAGVRPLRLPVTGRVGFTDQCSTLRGPPQATFFFRTPVPILAWFWPRLRCGLNPEPACDCDCEQPCAVSVKTHIHSFIFIYKYRATFQY